MIDPQRHYDSAFKSTPDYRASLPDMQNRAFDPIPNGNVPILQVGSANFRLPLKYKQKNSPEVLTLETNLVGTVSLSENNRGINMSRIVRTLYDFENEIFTPALLEKILQKYLTEIKTNRAQLKLSFNYPIIQKSLRSGLSGYQYYNCAYEGILENGKFKAYITFDFVYSSSCPCSTELAEHARHVRNVLCVPHSQRSKARIFAEINPESTISIEDFQIHCANALKTETQVMVKREDEQAFAELNGAYYKFVEDATRLLYAEFNLDSRILDFQIVCAHLESLHSHDAVAVINKGIPNGINKPFTDFKDLIC